MRRAAFRQQEVKMKTRTGIHAGANEPTSANSSLQACKQQKEYWMGKAQYMENVLANCHTSYPSYPSYPTYPTTPTYPTSGGGYSGGVWYPDRSGLCG
jgi:hypothetical protein